jgi:hypothetical protein
VALEDAVRIPGATAVALIAADGPALTWWAGGRTPTEEESASAAGVAGSAAALVRLSEGGKLDDVLVTSATAFHVLRLIPGEDGADQVAHLMLRRAGANLAMARHEFRTLVEAHAREANKATGRHTATPRLPAVLTSSALTPPSSPSSSDWPPRSPQPGPAEPEPERGADFAHEADGAADPADLPRLPRRRPGNRNGLPAAATAVEPGAVSSAWLDLFGQPYGNDEIVLERVLDTLKNL